MKKAYGVVAVGDICLDMKTEPLSGFSLGDRQFRVKDLALTVGGNSANFCLGTASLGLETSLICSLGADPVGEMLKKRMAEAGVRCVIKKPGTGTTAITYGLTHTDGTRQLISFNGTNLQLSEGHIDYSLVKKASALHRSGFWWTPKLYGKPTAKLLRFAKDCGAETSLDIATDPEGWLPERREIAYQALEHTDIFFANDTELIGVSGRKNLNDAVNEILGLGTGMVAAHLGPKGSAVFTKKENVNAPAFEIKPRNPIGSGDIFNAGFTFARSRNWDLKRCLRFANACAAYYMERVAKPLPVPSAVRKRFGV